MFQPSVPSSSSFPSKLELSPLRCVSLRSPSAQSLQVHLSSTQGPIEAFLCSDDPVPMEAVDGSANGNHGNPLVPYSSFVQVSSKGESCTQNVPPAARLLAERHFVATETEANTRGGNLSTRNFAYFSSYF